MAANPASAPFPFAIQREEFHFDPLVASDHELAYRLQLEEALAASAAMAATAPPKVASSSSYSSSVAAVEQSGFLSTDRFRAFEPVASAVAAGALASASSSSSSSLAAKQSGFLSMDRIHSFVPGSTMAAGGVSSTEDGFWSIGQFRTFAPAPAMDSGAHSSKDKGLQPTGCFRSRHISTDDKCFWSTDDIGTFVPASAMPARGISLKEEEEEGFPSMDSSHTFAPVSAMATGSFSSKHKEGFPLTGQFRTFIPERVPAIAAGGLSLKGKEGFPSTDCFSTFIPGSAMAAGGFSLMDHSLALSLQSLELSWLQQEAVDRQRAASEAEQSRAKICQMAHDAELARRIHEVPNREWEEHGDLLENSLEIAPSAPPLPSHLYFASIRHGEDKDAASSSPTATSFMGMAILDQSGNALMEMKKPLGSPSTKIESDYMALILSLEGAQSAGFQHVQAYTDSVLLYNQVKRKWKLDNNKILTLWSQVMMYIHKFQGFELHLLVKNENQHATRLARDAINSKPLAGSKNASSLHDNIRNVNEEVLENCTICLEDRAGSVMVTVTPCSHRFCMSCIVQHMEAKVQAGQVPVQCPHLNCKSSFSLEQCKAVLSQKWFDLLMRAMREASIPEQERVYCPFPQCSALMLKKDLERTFQATSSSSSSSLSNSSLYNRVTCVECRRFFCHYCRVPWHYGMSCEEHQNSPLNGQNTQEAYLYGLARDQKWQRCKKCRRMIELAEGCYHITCWCGHEFCYVCGSEWVDKKKTCKCRLWDEQNLIWEPAGQNIAGFVGIMADIDSDGSDQSDGELYNNDDKDIESLAFERQQAATNPLYKTKLCWHYERGHCWAGRNCEFAHGMHELR